MSRTIRYWVLAVAIGAPSLSGAQTSKAVASERIEGQCKILLTLGNDLNDLSRSLRDNPTEQAFAQGLWNSVFQSGSACTAAHELVFVTELLSPSAERTRVVFFVRASLHNRVESLGPEISYANDVLARTHLAGVAQSAAALRDKLRVVVEVLQDVERELK